MMQLKAVNAEKVGGYSYDVTLKVHKTDLVGLMNVLLVLKLDNYCIG